MTPVSVQVVPLLRENRYSAGERIPAPPVLSPWEVQFQIALSRVGDTGAGTFGVSGAVASRVTFTVSRPILPEALGGEATSRRYTPSFARVNVCVWVAPPSIVYETIQLD